MTTETEHNLNGRVPGYEPGLTDHDMTSDSSVGAHGRASIHEGLPAWERVKLARHPDRPHTIDYIQRLCTDFVELHGDRLFGDDAAIVGGLGVFDGQTVMLI